MKAVQFHHPLLKNENVLVTGASRAEAAVLALLKHRLEIPGAPAG